MKKRFFVKLIIIITIFTAIIVYIIQHKLDELVLKPGKEFIKEFSEEQIRQELAYVKQSPEKDTLMQMAADYFIKFTQFDNPAGKEGAEKELSKVLKDSIITPGELQRLKIIMKD